MILSDRTIREELAAGRIVIDANNAANVSFEGDVPTFTPAELGGKTSSEIVAGLVPGARVVKA